VGPDVNVEQKQTWVVVVAVVVVAVVEHDTQMALRPLVCPGSRPKARGCAPSTMQPTLNKNVDQSAQ
jgi:hypothetical protein